MSNKKFKKGDICSLTQYFKIVDVNDKSSRPNIVVECCDSNTKFTVMGSDLLNLIDNSSDSDTEESLPKTKLAVRFSEITNEPFKVVFTKKDGSERVLKGRKDKKDMSSYNVLGYSNVVDLEKPASEHRVRMVNHNTLKEFTVGGKTYKLKSK